MNSKQLTVAHCAVLSGLGPHEIVVGTTPTAMHDFLYAGYLLHHGRGWEAVGDMIVADIRSSLELGALKPAADLLIVLRRFLLECLRMASARCLYSNQGAVILSRVPGNRPVELRAWDACRQGIIIISECAFPRSPFFALRAARRRADRR